MNGALIGIVCICSLNPSVNFFPYLSTKNFLDNLKVTYVVWLKKTTNQKGSLDEIVKNDSSGCSNRLIVSADVKTHGWHFEKVFVIQPTILAFSEILDISYNLPFYVGQPSSNPPIKYMMELNVLHNVNWKNTGNILLREA